MAIELWAAFIANVVGQIYHQILKVDYVVLLKLPLQKQMIYPTETITTQ